MEYANHLKEYASAMSEAQVAEEVDRIRKAAVRNHTPEVYKLCYSAVVRRRNIPSAAVAAARISCRAPQPAARPHTMYSKSRLLVMNMCPGACVIANSGLDAITAACGVTPHAQNTGTSPGSNTGASP